MFVAEETGTVYDIQWQYYANCLGVNLDLFYPERGVSTREAKAVCAECVVRTECLEYALVAGEKFGIWGGVSERERRRMRRQRAIASGKRLRTPVLAEPVKIRAVAPLSPVPPPRGQLSLFG